MIIPIGREIGEIDYTMKYRIINRIFGFMKVTALIPDHIIEDLKAHSQGKNLTECLMIALEDWINTQKIKALNKQITKEPFKFLSDFSAENVRSINRN